ncbi:hypothetical protein JCM21900_001200 [Sporobolomyces salmonicolor]
MSLSRCIPSTRALISRRCTSLPLLSFSRLVPPFTSLSTPVRLSASPATRVFSATAAKARYSAVADDPRWKNGDKVTYDELKPITQSPDDKILLIDVREPSEVALGSIPSSVNLPLSTFEKSLAMDEGDFTRTHGFHKPEKGQAMIFYCRAGVRAGTAADLAKRAGYKYARNYEGSWLDWEKHEGSQQSQDD